MNKSLFTLLAAGVVLLTACEKEISIDLNSVEPQLVIAGAITNQPGPYRVSLSQTINFSEVTGYPPVSGAFVIIDDLEAGVSDTLTEQAPGQYITRLITGTPGHSYQLRVVADEKTYSAISTMPQVVPLDTVEFPVFSSPFGNNAYQTLPVFTDPADTRNYYRFLLSVNGEFDKAYIIANDEGVNGKVNERPILSQALEIVTGDTVFIEMRSVDLSTYTYFFSLSQIAGNGPGGGTTPANPPNNITGGYALGQFSAYTVQQRIQIVPE